MWFHGNESFVLELYPLFSLVLRMIGERSIFYYNPDGRECNWSWFQQHNFTNQPQWIWNKKMTYFTLKEQNNDDLFVLACLSQDFYMLELMELKETLNRLKNVQILIELANSDGADNNNSLALDILKYMRSRNMINVALYFQKETQPLTIYSFELFPRFSLLQRRLRRPEYSREFQTLFPNQLQSLKGNELRALYDFSEPNTIIYRDAKGKKIYRGFMVQFINTFAESIDARLIPVFPTWPAERLLSESYMLELTKNGSVDFGLYTAEERVTFPRTYQYSYPIFIGNWCTMMPLERSVRRRDLLGNIFEIKALALVLFAFVCYWLCRDMEFILFHRWIRQCLLYVRVTYRFFAILLFIISVAQLISVVTKRPNLSRIESFEELLKSGLRIFGLSAEFDKMDQDFRAKYAAVFRLTRNISEFHRMRSSFNTSWAYSIPSYKWLLFNQMQRHFQRPIYRYSELCFGGTHLQSIIISRDSIYRDILQLYIIRVQQSGLILYWTQNSLYDLIKAGKVKLKDYSVLNAVKPLSIEDLYLVWSYCGVGLLLSLFVFGIELLRFYVNEYLNLL